MRERAYHGITKYVTIRLDAAIPMAADLKLPLAALDSYVFHNTGDGLPVRDSDIAQRNIDDMVVIGSFAVVMRNEGEFMGNSTVHVLGQIGSRYAEDSWSCPCPAVAARWQIL